MIPTALEAPTTPPTAGHATWLIQHPVFDVLDTARWPIDPCQDQERGGYVATFWLPTVGPTAYLALVELARVPAGHVVSEVMLGGKLGVSPYKTGKAIQRLAMFRLVGTIGGALHVPTTVVTLPLRLQGRLPEALRMLHRGWV